MDDLRRIRPWNLHLINDEMHQDAIAGRERMLACAPAAEKELLHHELLGTILTLTTESPMNNHPIAERSDGHCF